MSDSTNTLMDLDDNELAAMLLLDEDDDEQWPQFGLSPPSPPPPPPPPLSSPSPSSSSSTASTEAKELYPSATLDASAQRRRRHRESMARYRQEQRDRVAALRSQEAALQRILAQVLAHKKPVLSLGSSSSSSTSSSSLQQYQTQFTELVRLREALRLEKHGLRATLAASGQRARALHRISELLVGTGAIPRLLRPMHGVCVRYDDDDAPFYYEPVDEAACRATIVLGLQKMHALLQTLPQTQLPRPPAVETSSLLGWHVERAFTETDRLVPVMLFRFARRVASARATLDAMIQRAWTIYTSPAVMTESSAASVRSQLVQQVHDDIVIMIRNAPEKQRAGRSRYLTLYHKMTSVSATGRSEMVFTMLLNRSPQEERTDVASSVRGKWLQDGCALLRLTEKPASPANRDVGVDVEYMGYIEVRDAAHGNHMWTELCLLMLLWEQTVVPQQLLAPRDDGVE